MDSGIHKGWNSFDFENTRVKTFRFVGKEKNSCRVGEVEVKGIEVFDSPDGEVSCTPKLTIGGKSKVLDNS